MPSQIKSPFLAFLYILRVVGLIFFICGAISTIPQVFSLGPGPGICFLGAVMLILGAVIERLNK